jgi:hypothetical protein
MGWAGWAGLLAGKKRKGPLARRGLKWKKGSERERERKEFSFFF